MKLNNTMITVLWISLLAIPPAVQAGNDEVLRGFMGVMQQMQKQGADADPNSKAIMDAFGDAINGKNDRRRGKDNRQGKGKGKGKGKDDRRGKSKGDRQRQGKSKGDRQRQGKNRGDLQGNLNRR